MGNAGFESVVGMFERCVSATPDRKAVIGDHTFLTYAELNEYANRLANALIYNGIESDDIVMILLPRNFMYYAVNIGVLKSGAAYTAANTSYPDERIKFICEDSSARYIITTRRLYRERPEVFEGNPARPLFLEDLLASQWPHNPGRAIGEHDLAYCIYTSGSTGRPKGVMIEHGNLSNFLEHDPGNREVMDIVENGSTMIANAAFTFDFSLMEEFISLTSGMTVVLATEEQILNPLLFNERMISNRVDAICCTPSYLNTLLSIPALHEAIKNIRVFDLGAEALHGELYTKVRKVNKDGVIINGYGPTEATISCTSKIITSSEKITIGKPASNVSCYIVDKDLNELPQGEQGELLICGKGVGRGYINLEEQTKKAFVEFRGMRAYRTGDLARIDENGEIDFRGRMDSQVKLRGLRIELEEVENIMANCSLIVHCAATVVDDRYLCLYYVLKDPDLSEEDSRNEIREFAGKNLAHYMVPDIYMPLKQMPMTNNWKIDRKNLPRPEIRAVQGRAPETDIQKYIFNTISDIAGRPMGGTDVSLVDEGLSSLDMMMITAAIGEKYQVPLTISDIVSGRNILELEELILEKKKGSALQKVTRAHALLTQGLYYRLWHMYNSTENVMSCALKIDNEVATDQLISAVRGAAGMHPGLFISFEDAGDDSLMISVPEASKIGKLAENIPVSVFKTTEDEIPGIMEETGRELMYPGGDNYEFRVYETDTNKYLVMRFAHILGDADSVGILADDILKLCDGREAVPEAFDVVQYAAENDSFAGASSRDELPEHYKKLFEGLAKWPSLSDNAEADATGFVDTAVDLPMTFEDTDRITNELSVSENILFSGLTALVLGKYSLCRRFPLVIAYSGRDDYRVKNTFGFLVRPVVICGEAKDDMTLKDYLHSISRQFFEGMMEAVPLKKMHELYPEWTDYLFIYQAGMAEEHTLFGKTVSEDWLAAMSEEGEEEVIEDGADRDMAGADDILSLTAGRWAAYQTSFQVFPGEAGYSCDITSPLGRYDEALPGKMLEDMKQMCLKLKKDPLNITIGELFS
ncbi:MAG: amino acid adenylation domain-containing protein [Lachnospiraceae bacterium]|nr:amino acid adenylation domain-containing protein [Lachnospiraceae bacterium]